MSLALKYLPQYTYKKQTELKDENFEFDLGKCKIDVHFDDIWQ